MLPARGSNRDVLRVRRRPTQGRAEWRLDSHQALSRHTALYRGVLHPRKRLLVSGAAAAPSPLIHCAYGAQTDPPRADRRAGPWPKPGGGVHSHPAGDRPRLRAEATRPRAGLGVLALRGAHGDRPDGAARRAAGKGGRAGCSEGRDQPEGLRYNSVQFLSNAGTATPRNHSSGAGQPGRYFGSSPIRIW